ncbi:MAG: hypothetical protein C0623_03935 [Desulfuromonas sp.]|mgnify:CR=1 FL=1|nr:MAG: hypothetical protein C0623_03935 [Desulfuromonas sp.]
MLKMIWRTCCSLKLAIILASVATMLAMGGSLVMHFNPDVFADLDAMNLGEWSSRFGRSSPGLSWWFYITGTLVILLAVNTACCLIEWLYNFRARWRKTGEYLIHLGFVLIIIAYFWGSIAGDRSTGNKVTVGETIPLKVMPGHYLRLDSFEPLLNEQRRPVDMLNSVTLLKGNQPVASGLVKTNTPLLHNGLVITPATYGQLPIGFEVIVPTVGKGYRLVAGDAIPLNNGYRIIADAFLPDAIIHNGQIVSRSDNLREPAYLMRLLEDDKERWRGWYFLGQGLPDELRNINFQMVPSRPIYQTISVLTINRDPGAGLAMLGGIAISLGVFFALFSFYYKRARGDRPDIT